MGLSGQLSKLSPEAEKWLRAPLAQVKGLEPPTTGKNLRQRQVRLSGQQRAELVSRYQDGATHAELAAAYGIERRTSMAIVKRHGAQVTRGLSPAEIDNAVERYGAGDSLATIGRALGVAVNTVRARLLERGVTMRSSAGAQS